MTDKAKIDELSEEEVKGQLLLNERDIIAGLLDAADISGDTRDIEIVRNGRNYFTFRIRALSESEYTKCKKKYTTYKRNKQLGVRMPEETDAVRYRCALIYTATVDEDRAKTWDNKEAWKALIASGKEVVTGMDVIELCLRAGEKNRVIDAIDDLSGYHEEEELEDTVKN